MNQHTVIPTEGFNLYINPTDPSVDESMAFPTTYLTNNGALTEAIKRTCGLFTQHQRAAHFNFVDQAVLPLGDALRSAGSQSLQACTCPSTTA